MPYTKLNISGPKATETAADVLSWVSHALSPDEHQMLRNVSKLPVLFKHVALMPDAHLGIGSMVGSVVATKEAVIPATVGVDIGCGMMAVKTPFRSWVLDRKLKQLRDEIERAVPVGFKENRDPNSEAANWAGWEQFPALHEKVQERFGKARKQLGTLGGGNHFIEVCLDTEGIVWLMLHSGSRNIGNELATHHIKAARQLHDLQTLPDPNLAYFLQGTPEFAAYWHDLDWAQAYALKNREVMMNNLLAIIYRMFNEGEPFDPEITVNCHHNYVSIEEHYGDEVFVTRKGAIRADRGMYGIIPGSMGAKSFIVKGLGAAESFNSCSHGAGRKMSRTAARKKFSAKDLAEQTLGVECRKDSGVVDEIPGAYKDIAEVMRNQADLVEVVAELKQVVCVKG